jgi:recombination protein RecT
MQQAPRGGLSEVLNSERFKNEIERALPRHIDPGRMVRVVMTALRANPQLQQSTPESFFGCVLQASQLGLEPNTPLGHCYLIPRENRRLNTIETTLQIGYQGQIELSLRSGKVNGIYAHVVRKGDTFDYEYGLNPRLVHRPSESADRERQDITHVYAVGRIKDAEPAFEVLSRVQVEKRMARSASAHSNSSPWKTDFEAMVRKTGVRALWKWLPKSTEMARVDALEHAADAGRDQRAYFDMTVNEGLDRAGIQPILEAPAESDVPEPGSMDDEPTVEREPGAEG